MNEVELMLKDRTIQRGGVTLFKKIDALGFIETCATKNLKVLGIDAFLLLGEAIQPSMENSIDFTTSSFKGNPIQSARDHLTRSDDNLYFEIVCE